MTGRTVPARGVPAGTAFLYELHQHLAVLGFAVNGNVAGQELPIRSGGMVKERIEGHENKFRTGAGAAETAAE